MLDLAWCWKSNSLCSHAEFIIDLDQDAHDGHGAADRGQCVSMVPSDTFPRIGSFELEWGECEQLPRAADVAALAAARTLAVYVPRAFAAFRYRE
jgi:hypothetical protein